MIVLKDFWIRVYNLLNADVRKSSSTHFKYIMRNSSWNTGAPIADRIYAYPVNAKCFQHIYRRAKKVFVTGYMVIAAQNPFSNVIEKVCSSA